jgi:hypothetical protein
MKPVPFTDEDIAQLPELALSHHPICACGACPWVRWSVDHSASSYGVPVLLVGPTGDNPPCRSYASVTEALAHEPSFREK